MGTFEYFARRGKSDAVRTLADHVIERQYQDAARAANPYRALLDELISRQANLIAQWMLVGFIHGVMNTDNMSTAGETIDYGPCAFMDDHHAATVYSSIDHGGRYAYDQQPHIGHWNLARFAETLLPLLDETEDGAIDAARAALDGYPARFEASNHAGLRRKLGLVEEHDGDLELFADLLACMVEQRADFTLTFRGLSEVAARDPTTDAGVRSLFADPGAFDAWARRWRERLAAEARDESLRRHEMRAVNPAFIARNHRVQQPIDAATRDGDLQPLDELLAVVTRPYDDHPDLAGYARPPEVVRQTFCGT